MFSRLFQKVGTYAEHHQILFALIVGVCAVSFSWGVEKMLDTHVFPQSPILGYSIAIFGGLFGLFLTKHYVLHEL
jgi:uncharacterized membrane protein